jgi:hypothetical protein
MLDTSEASHIARNNDWRSGAHADSLSGTAVDAADAASVSSATIDYLSEEQAQTSGSGSFGADKGRTVVRKKIKTTQLIQAIELAGDIGGLPFWTAPPL